MPEGPLDVPEVAPGSDKEILQVDHSGLLRPSDAGEQRVEESHSCSS